MKSPSLKMFKFEMKNFSEQPDLTQSALSKGLEQMGNSGGLFELKTLHIQTPVKRFLSCN